MALEDESGKRNKRVGFALMPEWMTLAFPNLNNALEVDVQEPVLQPCALDHKHSQRAGSCAQKAATAMPL